jgi:hypothetical protein
VQIFRCPAFFQKAVVRGQGREWEESALVIETAKNAASYRLARRLKPDWIGLREETILNCRRDLVRFRMLKGRTASRVSALYIGGIVEIWCLYFLYSIVGLRVIIRLEAS